MPSPERIPLPDAPPPREVAARVRDALERGRLVAMPTETVYGIAARADDPASVEALRTLKGRDPAAPLTWHVGGPEPALEAPRLRPLVRRLVERYWPGPLTLVLDGVPEGLEGIAREGRIGVRLPAHRGTAGILAALAFPVVLSSANASKEPPLVEADAVARELGDGVALVLDGGRCRLGEASAVLRVGPGEFRLLRPGLLRIEELRRTAGLHLAFCCTGNTCRSPMAAELARAELRSRLGLDAAAGAVEDFGFVVRSMGVFASAGAPASPDAVEVLHEEGLDLSAHRSHPAIAEEVADLDRVYALTPGHLEALQRMLPPGKAENVELLDPDGEAVPDPIGGTRDDYRRTRDRIRELVRRRADEWA